MSYNEQDNNGIFDPTLSDSANVSRYSYEPDDYSNFDTDFEAGKPKNKKSGGGGGKKFAGILCLLAFLVGLGTIGYKYIGGNSGVSEDNPTAVVTTVNNETTAENPAQDYITDITDKMISADPAVNSDSGLHIVAPTYTNALTIPQIYEKVIPSVVGVRSTFSSGSGTGTGIIMTSDGYIITNAHVVLYQYTDNSSWYSSGQIYQEKASTVNIILSDENQTEYQADIIGIDSESDLAVLKINATDLTPAEFGDSDKLLVGEDVVAIGNPLGFELFGTLTKGIVSALNREVTINDTNMTLIQTDTAINSGNSGGPLINCYGQVIGVNSAKMSSSYTNAASIEGLAFAIPITNAKKIVDDLMEYGYVTGKPKLGLSCTTISDPTGQRYGTPIEGAYVASVERGGAAYLAGVRVGDIVTGVNDVKISSSDELINEKNKYSAGEAITLYILRNGETISLNVTLAENVAQSIQ